MNPGDLPNFGDYYLQYFDPYIKSLEIRRRDRTDGNLSISECMERVDVFLKQYQLTFIPNKIDNSLVLFPFLFIPPKPGDKILNIDTKETYIVDQIIDNPNSRQWEGLVKLKLNQAPSNLAGHRLEYVSSERYVAFNHEVPDSVPNPLGANSERQPNLSPPLIPTITWTVKSVEPGTLGAISSSKKELKPRLRESLKDPLVRGHTVQVYGQRLENIVQFDCWSHDPRTSDRLVRWFDQFMKFYTDEFRKAGIAQLIFLGRFNEETNQTWRQSYSVKSIQYQFTTEELSAKYIKDILKIDISIDAEHTPIAHLERNGPRWIADQFVSGVLTSEQYRNLFYRSGEYLFGNIDIKQ